MFCYSYINTDACLSVMTLCRLSNIAYLKKTKVGMTTIFTNCSLSHVLNRFP